MASLRKTAGRARALLFLAVVGPGFITANVDNDAGGIYTYSVAGAQFGYTLLWTMIPITVALVVVQEMASRMGAVTGKGLSDLIREEFGFRVTFFLMIALVVYELRQRRRRVRGRREQPRAVRRLEVHRRARRRVHRVGDGGQGHVPEHREDLPRRLRLLRLLHHRGPARASGLEGGRDRHGQPAARRSASATTATSTWSSGWSGTTIAPWMQFYLQASIVEKGITPRQYRASRWDVILGCLFTDVVAWFIIVACAATLFAAGHHDIEERGRRGAGAAPAGRRVRVSALRGGAVQRVAVRGVDSADLDGLRGLRRAGLRVGSGQEVPRGAGLLLALHAAHRRSAPACC